MKPNLTLLSTLKAKLILGGIVLVIIIGIVIYYSGKKAGKKDQSDIKLPEDSDWGKSNAISAAESATVASLAKQLYDDMKGIKIFSAHNAAVYQAVNNLSDRLLGALYHCYNENYGGSETLTKWMEGEVYSWRSFAMQGVVDSIVLRLKNLGLN